VKQFFDKLKEERKKRLNPEKPYFYVKREELRKVADQQKKQRVAQKKPALSDYERSVVKSSQPRKRVGKGVPQLGEVSKPVLPLIVPNQYSSNKELMPKKSLALSELEIRLSITLDRAV